MVCESAVKDSFKSGRAALSDDVLEQERLEAAEKKEKEEAAKGEIRKMH